MAKRSNGGTARRWRHGLAAVVAVGALVGPTAVAGTAQASQAAPSTTVGAAGVRTTPPLALYPFRSTPATGHVAPRPQSSLRASTVSATFVVTYHGFPANAKAAFQRAVDLWSVLVKSSVPIRVDATWTTMGDGILGGARAGDYIRDFSGAPRSATWYPAALANARAGTDLSPSPDIEAQFNSAGIPWYLGTDGNVPAGELDLTSVVLHEIGHGLGLSDSTDVSDGRGYWGGDGYPTAYDRFVQTADGHWVPDLANGTTALAAYLQSDALRWGGANGTAAAGTRPWLYSPNPFEVGSSVAHLDEDVYATGTANALMTPYLDDGEALHDPGDIGLGMLKDIGWTVAGPKGVPAAPTLTSALAGNQQVFLAWKAPVDTGRQFLTGFRVYRYPAGAGSPDATYTLGTATTATITGLANGTPYRFSVAAFNPSGTGLQSAQSGTVAAVDLTPFARSDAFVAQQFQDFLGRAATAAESSSWLAALHGGTRTPGGLVDGVSLLAGSGDVSARATRLYSAYFLRLPDLGGYRYWTGKLRTGTSLKKVSDTFAASSEFKNRYGSLTNRAFVTLVYANVLKRSPDSGGLGYWVKKLDAKAISRGGVMLQFSESSENTRKMASEVTSVLLRSGMLRRMPTAGEYAADQALLDGGATAADLAAQLLALPEYGARIP
jgi:hypothetical protein